MKRCGDWIPATLATLVVACGCGKQPVALKTVHGQSIEHWMNELKRPEPKARKTAIAALQSAAMADPAAIPAIIGELSDSDAKVRDAAAIALLNIGPPAKEAVEALNKAKADQDPTVRSHAERALQRIVPSS